MKTNNSTGQKNHPNQKYQKNTSFKREDLSKISEEIKNNIQNILEKFGVDFKVGNRYITGVCPLHENSDNPMALNINYKTNGKWKCNTHHCEKIFMSSPIGLIRGLLSSRKLGWKGPSDSGKIYSFPKTLEFLNDSVGLHYIDHVEDAERKRSRFNQVLINSVHTKPPGLNISRDQVLKSLKIPSKYFVERGFSSQILEKYDVGDCLSLGKPFYNRAVVPIYNSEYDLIGCTGRSFFEKCLVCGQHHIQEIRCPENGSQPKWLHSNRLPTRAILYNDINAKPYIQETRTAILVEGTADVWKLEEAGIHNSLAMFGTMLSSTQLDILNSLGCTTIKIMTDNDDAGNAAFDIMNYNLKNLYNIERPSIETNDIGDMAILDLQETFK